VVAIKRTRELELSPSSRGPYFGPKKYPLPPPPDASIFFTFVTLLVTFRFSFLSISFTFSPFSTIFPSPGGRGRGYFPSYRPLPPRRHYKYWKQTEARFKAGTGWPLWDDL
jgi:hypothetical protein